MKFFNLSSRNLFYFIGTSASFLLVFFIFAPSIWAGIEHNVSGWAWSENIGWVSMNSINCEEANKQQAGACNTGVNYGVNIQDDGSIIGWAWSENLGWICWGETCQPYGKAPDSTEPKALIDLQAGQISGWFKFVGLGEEGWSKLSGQVYGTKLDLKTGAFSEFGWNASAFGQGIGWLSFSCKNQNICDKSNYQVITSWRFVEKPICVCGDWQATKECENNQRVWTRDCVPDQCLAEKSVKENCEVIISPGSSGGSGGEPIWPPQESITEPTEPPIIVEPGEPPTQEQPVVSVEPEPLPQPCASPEECDVWENPWREIKDGSVYVNGNINEQMAPFGKFNVSYLIRAKDSIVGWISNQREQWWMTVHNKPPGEPRFVGEQSLKEWADDLVAKTEADPALKIVNGNLDIKNNILKNDVGPGAWVVTGNINIGTEVTEIAGAFYSAGTISTGAGKQLTVHGSLAANKFQWQRTKGSIDRGSEQIIFDGRLLFNPPAGLTDKKKGLPLWREGVVSP